MTDKEQIICTEEICPYCDNTVELPPFKGIYECPKCKELIVCCSMCEEQSCNECKYTLLTQSKEQLSRKTQECEDLRQMYKSMVELCEAKDDAILEKHADIEELKEQLETAEKWRIKAEGLNEKFELKNTCYRKVLEEIEKIVGECPAFDYNAKQILDIINKAKEEE